jgi:hypothetical protein
MTLEKEKLEADIRHKNNELSKINLQRPLTFFKTLSLNNHLTFF